MPEPAKVRKNSTPTKRKSEEKNSNTLSTASIFNRKANRSIPSPSTRGRPAPPDRIRSKSGNAVQPPQAMPPEVNVAEYLSSWGNKKQLTFLCEAADRFLMIRDYPSLLLKRLEKTGINGVTINWMDRLCEPVRKYLEESNANDTIATYKTRSVKDLLRAIRNLKNHYSDLPEDVRSALGKIPEEFIGYFTRLFPHLLPHVYEVMEWCSDELIFTLYYSDEVRNRMKEIREQAEENRNKATSTSKDLPPPSLPFSNPLSYDEKDILGKGSQGTMVFTGIFYDRVVAVKRVLNADLAMNERDKLLKLRHPNVIQYIYMQDEKPYILLVLQKCAASLYQYIEKRDEVKVIPETSPKEIIQQITKGLEYLHFKHTVHRDLKPRNVLISMIDNVPNFLISDFGLAKSVDPENSISRSSGLVGSDGWIPPEILTRGDKGEQRLSSSDIFPLGCIFYYIITKGGHPFGMELHRTSNIAKGKKANTKALERTEDCSLSRHLITLAISRNPNDRPNASEILNHTYFWAAEKRVHFLCEASDRLARLVFLKSPLPSTIEDINVIKGDWKGQIDSTIVADLLLRSKYDGILLRDLLRAIRNLKHHYREMPNSQTVIGEMPNEFIIYFTSRFPDLLLHVYLAMKEFANEDEFKQYYGASTTIE